MDYYETASKDGYIQAYEHHLDQIRLAKLQKIKPHGRLLDVGCAFGFFLKKAKERGYETMGVEISKEASQYGIEKFGLKVINSSLDKVNLPPEYFEIITLWHFIEHLDDPFGALVLLKKCLQKDGILVVEVPNEFNSLFMRLRGIKYWRKEPITSPPRHLFYLTPATLKCLLQKSGYRVIKVETENFSNEKFWSKRGYAN